MKKGLLLVLAVVMLLGITSCTDEPAIVVSDIELEKTSYYVSSDYLNNVYYIVVSNILPVGAESKTVKFELVDAEIEGLDGHNWSEVVDVSSTGVVSFKSTTLQLENVHSTFNVLVSCGNASKTVTFYMNCATPTSMTLTFKGNDKFAVSSETKDTQEYKVVDLVSVTGYDDVTLDFGFATDVYPAVNYSEVDSNIITIDKETNTIKAVGSGCAEVTVACELNAEVTETFIVYVNAVKTNSELKAFLCDTSTEETGNRKSQLNAAKEAYLTKSLTDLKGVITANTSVKKLIMNGNAITFKSNDSSNGFKLGGALTVDAKAEGSKITMSNTTQEAKLFYSDSSVELKIDGGEFVASSTTSDASVITSNGNVVITNGNYTANSSSNNTARTIVLNGTGTITSATVVATGKTATALTATKDTTVVAGSYTATSTLSSSTAVALDCTGLTTGTVTVKEKDSETKPKFTADAKTATGVKVNVGGKVDISNAVIDVDGDTAVGLNNVSAGETKLTDVTITVDGTDVNNVYAWNETCSSVIGILNQSKLTCVDSLDISVYKVGTNNTYDVCGICNALNSSVLTCSRTDVSDSTKKINVKITVEYGGGYALRNQGIVTLNNVVASFSANRFHENTDAASYLYALYNISDGGTQKVHGIFVNDSNVSFVATSVNNTAKEGGKYLGIQKGYVEKGVSSSSSTVVIDYDPEEN